MGFLFWKKEKKFGFTPVKNLVKADINGSIATSRIFKYRFTLPAGCQFKDVTEFNNTNYKEKNVSFLDMQAVCADYHIGVIVVILDGTGLVKEWSEREDMVVNAMLQKTFMDFDPEKLESKEFMGLPCRHYKGILNRTFADGKRRYQEQYEYCAPFCTVNFNVSCWEEFKDNLPDVFSYFRPSTED